MDRRGEHRATARRLRRRAVSYWEKDMQPWEREQLLALAADCKLDPHELLVAVLTIAEAAKTVARLESLAGLGILTSSETEWEDS